MGEQTLSIRLTADGKGLVGELRSASGELRRFGTEGARDVARVSRAMRDTEQSADGMSSRFAAMGRTLGTALSVSAIAGFGRAIVDASSKMNTFNQVMLVVTGSQRAADAEMAFVRENANRLGIALVSSADAYAKLTASARGTTLEGQNVRDIFSAVSEASRVLNLSSDQTSGALQALQQMISKGAVQSEELRGQLGERLPGAYQLAAKAMGVTTAELGKMLEAGKVTADVLLPKLAKELHAVYGAQAAAAGRGPSADIARLGNAVTEALANIGNAGGVLEGVAAGARVLATWVTNSAAAFVQWSREIRAGFGELSQMLADAQRESTEFGQYWDYLAGVFGTTWATLTTGLAQLPANLRAIVTILIGEADKFAIDAGAAFDVFGITAERAWLGVSHSAETAWIAVKLGFASMQDSLLQGLSSLMSTAGDIAAKVGLDSLSAQYRAAAAGVGQFANAEAQARQELATSTLIYQGQMAVLDARTVTIEAAAAAQKQAANNAIDSALQERQAALDASAAASTRATATERTAAATHDSTVATTANAQSTKAAEAASRRFAEAQGRLADIAAKARGELSPMAKVAADYETALRDIANEGGKAIKAIRDHAKETKNFSQVAQQEAQIQGFVSAAIKGVTLARDKDAAAIAKQGDVLGEYLRELNNDRAMLGLTERQRSIADAVQNATDKWNANTQAGIENKQTLAELQGQVAASEGAYYDQAHAIDAARASAQRYASIVRGAFDSMIDASAQWAVNGFRNAKEFWRGMVDQVKRAVAQMLAEWARTKIIGWFTGNNTGGTGNWMGAVMSAFGASGSGSSGSGGGFNLGGSVTQIGMDYATGGSGGGFGGSSLGTTAGQYAPWLGALAGAYMGSQRGDGGVGTVGSTIAYAGLGYTMGSLALSAAATVSAAAAATATAATATAAAATTTAGAAGVAAAGTASGAAAGAGTAAAVGAGGTAVSGAAVAIPIIGWVLAIIAAIDYASGGKVFGTKYRPERSTVSLGLGEDGATASASLDEWKYRRNILQFNKGGSLEAMRRFGEKNKRTRDIAPTEEMIRAAEDLFKSIEQVMADSAHRLEVETPPMIDAALNTVVEYDKKGKVKATKYFVEVLGKTYEEATSELAVTRLAAEAQINVASAATAGEASRIAEHWRYSAQKLSDGAELLLTAQADIVRGQALLGEGSTLTQVVEVVEGLTRAGEGLAATYSRLVVAVANVKDAFELAGVSINRTGADLVEFANDIVIRAGGDDAAKALFQRFFSAFYSQNELGQMQVDRLRPQLNTGLTALGLDTNTSMEEFRAAFNERLPTLTAEQVVQWLRLGDVLATVTELVDKIGDTVEEAAEKLKAARTTYAQAVVDIDQQLIEISGGGMSNFQKALAQIGATESNSVKTLNELARAAGIAGAREMDLAKVHTLASARAAQAAMQLEAASRDIVAQLYGGTDIAASAASVGASFQSVASGIDAMQSAADRFRDAMLLDDQLSPLNAQQQLEEALRQLRATGDENIGRRALEIGRGMMASGDDWRRFFDMVTGLIRPRTDEGSEGAAGVSGASIEEQMSQAQRLALAQQLAQNVADLSGFGDKSFADVADMLGFTLTQLGSDLGLQGQSLNDYLESLQAESYGLDDLSSVIAREVDRIIAALGGEFSPIGGPVKGGPELGGPAYSDGAPAPVMSGGKGAGPETITAPYVERRVEPTTNDGVGAQAVVDAVITMTDALATALARIAAATEETGAATKEAVQVVASETRESVRQIRSLAESVNVGRGFRTAEVLR